MFTKDDLDDMVVELLDSNQTSDTYSREELEQIIAKYVWSHMRPGCSCDDCTDSTCPNNQ